MTTEKSLSPKQMSRRIPAMAARLALSILLAAPLGVAARTVRPAQPFPLGLALAAPAQIPPPDSSVTGMRFSLAYGQHADMMGLDIGVLVSVVDGNVFGLEISGLVNSVGSSSGTIQIGGIANNCYEDFCGCQIAAIANRAGGTMQGGQIGCFNMGGDMNGIQIGLYNKAETASGLQIGVINEAATMQGIQLGLLNIQHNGAVPFFPILNIHF